jgi:hypothetical protein
MLIGDKIWAFPLTPGVSTDKVDLKEIICPTYISLGPNPLGLQVNLLDSNTFCISNSSQDSTVSQESPLTAIAQKIRRKDVFKAKNTHEAQKWMLGIANFVQGYRDNADTPLTNSENDVFVLLDEEIENHEMARSQDFYNQIPVMNAVSDARKEGNQTCSLIDVLTNRYVCMTESDYNCKFCLCSQLRDRFKRYLQSKGSKSLLILWEYCEDFRRGHPLSSAPYETVDTITIFSKWVLDNGALKMWHEKVCRLWDEVNTLPSSIINRDGVSNGRFDDAHAFDQIQHICWAELIKLSDEFVKTNEYWEVVLRLAGNMTTVSL